MAVFPYKDDNEFVQIDLHRGLYYPVPPSPFPVPLPGPHIGTGRLSWGPGWGHKDNRGKVLADGHRLISQGHEVANVIVPHSNIPPLPPGVNILFPLLILGSSNESHFACSSVHATDGPVAVAIGRTCGWNLACNDEWNLPTSLVRTGGTVLLDFTLADFIRGIANMAISSVLSFAFDKLASKAFKLVPKSIQSQLGMFYHRAVKNLPGLDGVGKGVFNQKAVQGILAQLTGLNKGLPGFQSIPRNVSESMATAAANTIKSMTGLSEFIPSL